MTITHFQHSLETATFYGRHNCNMPIDRVRPHGITINYKDLKIARQHVLNKQRLLGRELNGKQFDNAVIGLLGEYAAGYIIAAGADDRGYKSFAEDCVKWLSINNDDDDVTDLQVRGFKLEVKTSTNFNRYGAMVNINQMGRVMARSSHCIWMEAQRDLDEWKLCMRGWLPVNLVANLPVETFITNGSRWSAHQDVEVIEDEAMGIKHFSELIDIMDGGLYEVI